MYEDLLREAILTWFGISRLLLGNRMQFLHILFTRSSLMTTISWLQYWILGGISRMAAVNFSKNRQKLPHIWSQMFKSLSNLPHKFYLQGLVVNTENGTLCLKSSVMCSARGGLEQKDFYVLNMNIMMLKSKSLSRLTLAGWCLVQGLQVQEQKQSDFCWCRMKRLNCGQLPVTANHCENFNGAYPLWMLGWAHIISARAFNDSKEKKISIITLYFLC